MKAAYSLLIVATLNNKIAIKESHLSESLDKKHYKQILDYAYTLINKDDYLDIDGKPTKLTFFGLDEHYYIINIRTKLDLEYNLYEIRIMDFVEKELNPFNSFIFNYFLNENDNKDLILKDDLDSKIDQAILNKYLNSDLERILGCYLELLMKRDKPIFIYAKAHELPFFMAIAGLLLPSADLFNLSYTYGSVFKQMKNFSVVALVRERMLTGEDYYFIDFDKIDYPDIYIDKYSSTLISHLYNSLDEAKNYKEAIEELMQKHHINSTRAAFLNDLISGNINSFTKTKDLADAISDSNYEYNNQFIASAIYASLNKFIINNDILAVYKYVFTYVESSHEVIISSFFNNLNKFGISINNKPDVFLNLIINNAPFDLVYYYDYLVNNNLYESKLSKGLDDFNDWYLLLEAICRDIKLRHKVIVPNDTLLKYIKICVLNKKIDYLDLILDRIDILNHKARSRLLYLVFNDIFKTNGSYIDEFGIYYTFRMLERIDANESYVYYLKSYNSIKNRNEFIDLFIEREAKKPDYYALIEKYLIENGIKDFKEKRDLIKFDKNNHITLEYLDDMYESNYSNYKLKDNGLFTEKVFDYLNNEPYNDKLKSALEIYNRYYKSLKPGYKDLDSAIRKLQKFIYQYPDLIFTNDLSCYKDLFSIEEYLEKKKETSGVYFDVLRVGLDIKKSYVNKEFRFEYLKKLMKQKNKWFDELGNEYFNRYYLQYLIKTFFEFIPSFDKLNNFDFIILGYDTLFDSLKESKGFKYAFINTILNMEITDIKIQLMYLLIYKSNNPSIVYDSIEAKIKEEIKKPIKLYKEYYKLAINLDMLGDLKTKYILYLDKFIVDSSGRFKRFLWNKFKI